ncbi:transmembrane protein, putative (macronuclear) [Tetrahymena thermophila SB210]|uniref:Transmembrane protein, putative n=1 Tax=Tetrahymena thermophila (strain SB210) TaxID=312017 RepID=W7XF35_TETTS|nr:transmembrane protein, putative [Tetrahymena thermophila SB210]EWS75398.1 transmembrane protein, putative [Tetrahymena thermophila SB210]|eukprot:XP_012652072.1 transmembrane protein, putative [Tetrahymena thermophila SB210]
MKEKLIQEERQIDESIGQELQAIIYKYRRHTQKERGYLEDSNFRSMKQKDPESFQNEYSMSKFPGDVDEAKQKKKNQTIYEIYLNQRKKKIDWLFFNIYQESYLIERYGMGVPLFFTMMKMTIAVLLILFFANLYTGLNQFNVCDSDQCYSFIGGGLGIIDIVNLPSDFMISFSFASWLVFSYIFKLYIYRICETDDENRHDYVAKSNQIILKYFQKGLSQEQIEEQLTQKFYQYIEKEQISIIRNDMRISLAHVTPITNYYKISKKIKETNKVYMKIIKLMKSIDEEIMKPQQEQSEEAQNFKVFGSIPQINNLNYNKNENEIHNQRFKNSVNEPDQKKESQDEIEHKQLLYDNKNQQNTSFLEDQANLQNVNEEQKQITEELKTQEIEQSEQQQNQINVSKSLWLEKEAQNQIDIKEYNEQLSTSSSDDYRIQIVDLFYCQQLLRKEDDKKIKKLIKLIQKYQKVKLELQQEYISKKTLSSSYIVKCNSIQQKNLLLIFLKPSNPFKSFFQKAKYIFRSKYSSYSLDRYFPQSSTHLNINWQTIGIELQDKLKKQVLVYILGLVQFVIFYYFLITLYSFKADNDQNQENVTEQYLKKALFSLITTIFYLLSEKLYDFYSVHMITSIDSKRIVLYMQNLFTFYSLFYIILPLGTVFLYGINQLFDVNNNQYFEPFKQVRPFQMFVTNFLVAASLFSAKSIFPVKLIKKQIIQKYYLKSKRYLKKTQYELNKIFRRQKFRLEDCTLALFNLLVISIPFTFCLPILLILPILLLFIMYFSFKYQYLMVLRPGYYCKSIHKKTSRIFANYIQRISFFSYIFFTSNIFILFSGVIFYLVYAIFEIIVVFYIKHNFKKKKASRFEFINNMIGHFQVEKKDELNTQLSQAVEQYCNIQFINYLLFYYNFIFFLFQSILVRVVVKAIFSLEYFTLTSNNQIVIYSQISFHKLIHSLKCRQHQILNLIQNKIRGFITLSCFNIKNINISKINQNYFIAKNVD